MDNMKYQDLITSYVLDPENFVTNYSLGLYYDSISQTASAVSFYLRAAERTNIPIEQYKCLLLSANCFDRQGCRNFTVKGLLQQAIIVCPERPEAYFLLSRFYEKQENYHDSYLISSLGESNTQKGLESLGVNVGYPGYYGLIFEKAVSSWWCGLCDESKNLFTNLLENYEMEKSYEESVKDNLTRLWKDCDLSTSKFEWGSIAENSWFKNIVNREIFEEKIYEKFHEVKEGDVVVDIGANIGAFTYSIRDKKPSKVYCIEPSEDLISTLIKNVSGMDATIINSAFDSQTTIKPTTDVIYSHSKETYDTITFSEFIKKYKIETIDFLKTDCEGGEYEIFTEENFEYITNNVKYIVGEWHITGIDNSLDMFKKFRDVYLTKFNNYKIFEINEFKEVTHRIFDDEYLKSFKEWFEFHNDGHFIIYIDNTNCVNKIDTAFSFGSTVKPRIWIVDDFYDDPDSVRKFAMNQSYHEGGIGRGYIGKRTFDQFLFDGIKQQFEKIMGMKITKWEEYGMNGRFQYNFAGEPLVYHCDAQKYAGMIYLTPDAPFECGTTLYAHKKTRIRHNSHPELHKVFTGETHLDKTPYEIVDVIGNVYNRLAIFDSGCIHSASEYFGYDQTTARMWHMFFFDAE